MGYKFKKMEDEKMKDYGTILKEVDGIPANKAASKWGRIITAFLEKGVKY